MNINLFYTIVAVLVAVIISVLLITFISIGKSKSDSHLPPITQNSSSTSVATLEYEYILKEYNKKIGVFTPDEQEIPTLILDVSVKYLPEYDQGQLSTGIFVEDYTKLISLIEDYTS